MVEMKRKTNFTDISIIQWNRFFSLVYVSCCCCCFRCLKALSGYQYMPMLAGISLPCVCVCVACEHRMYHMSVLYMHASIANIWKQRVPAYNRCVHFSVEINKHYCASYVVCI